MTCLGIDLVLIKELLLNLASTSTQVLSRLLKEIGYINAPGDIPPDFANIAFTKVSNPFWPKEPGPFWTPVD